MSILKNLFAAVGAVTLGAVAVGVVLGATTAMTADDDDFDLDELRDDAPCDGCRKCAEKKDENGEKKASDTADTDAGKAEEEPAEKAEEPETPAEAEEDKAEKQ